MVKDLNLAALELAIERGAGLDHRVSGRGLVHLAAEQGVRQGVRAVMPVLDRLLAAGLPIDGSPQASGTPLQEAVERCDPVLVKALLARGANAQHLSPRSLRVLLDQAHPSTTSSAQHVTRALRIVRNLVAAGLPPTFVDAEGRTPLHHASMAHSLPTINRLLDHGAVVNAQDGQGRTPLHETILSNSATALAAFERLVQAGADLNAADRLGITPLLRAVINHRVRPATQLLALGVNPAHDRYLNLSALDRMQQVPDLWAPLIVQHERQVLGQVLDEPPPTGTTVLPRARL